jgi:hypothetical protein
LILLKIFCQRTKLPPKFKSEGERRIARFLEDNLIKYQYEPGVLVNSYKYKPRIWYTDFYLPEFGTYIEYYGLAGRQNYDRGIKRKEVVYSKMGLDVIPVYPWTFAENWQGYIMEELEQAAIRRYRALMNKPYWSQSRTAPYRPFSPTRPGYHHGLKKHY